MIVPMGSKLSRQESQMRLEGFFFITTTIVIEFSSTESRIQLKRENSTVCTY